MVILEVIRFDNSNNPLKRYEEPEDQLETGILSIVNDRLSQFDIEGLFDSLNKFEGLNKFKDRKMYLVYMRRGSRFGNQWAVDRYEELLKEYDCTCYYEKYAEI